MQPETSDKKFKPLDASQPASADQKGVAVKPWPNSSNPSASPAPVANTPANCPRGAVKQDQPEKPPKPHTKDDKIKEAALRRAEVLSILYKHGAYIESEEYTKKAALKAVIRAHGIEKVAYVIGLRK